MNGTVTQHTFNYHDLNISTDRRTSIVIAYAIANATSKLAAEERALPVSYQVHRRMERVCATKSIEI